MIDPEKMRLFMQALKPDLPGLARQVFIENPQTALRELPGKLQASRNLLNQYEPGKGIDPRLMDQFMNLTGSFAPMGMTANVTKQGTGGLLDQLLYRAEQTSYKNPDQGAIFYSPNKAYTDLYMSEDRVLRTAKMPSDLLDIRKPKDKKMLEGWAKNKLGELEENFGRSTEVRDGYKMLQSGDISGAMANISLLVGKQNNQGIVPGIAEKLALTDLGRDAMTVREAGTEAADNFSVAFRNSEVARKYFKDLLE